MAHAQVLCPLPPKLHVVEAVRRKGPPSFATSTREHADRVRAAVLNAGFAMPTGAITVTAEPPTAPPALDLAVALATLLADPAHRHARQHGLVAWGHVALDGSARPGLPPPIGGLPRTPFVGRFWRPTDRIPEVGEDAVLTVVDVADLQQAWDVVVRFLDIEAGLQSV